MRVARGVSSSLAAPSRADRLGIAGYAGFVEFFDARPSCMGVEKRLAGPSGSARFADTFVALRRLCASSMAFFGLLGLDESRAFDLT